MGLGDFVEVASFSAFFAIMARLGTDITAANQIALQYMSLSFTAGIAIAMACSSLVSQYLGAKEADKAERVGYRATLLAMVVMGVIGLSYLVAPVQFIRVFSQDAEVIAAGVLILKLVALYQVFDAVGIVLAGALNGAGDTTFTMITKTLLAWGVFIPLTWFLTFTLAWGLRGAWIAALSYLTGLSVIYLWRFRSGHWKLLDV
jgi:MATE family multidrug resistance protein